MKDIDNNSENKKSVSDYDDTDDDDNQLIALTKSASFYIIKTRMPCGSSVISEIETADVEEIDPFRCDTEDDNDNESINMLHYTEPNKTDEKTKYDHLKVAMKKSNTCSNHSMKF